MSFRSEKNKTYEVLWARCPESRARFFVSLKISTELPNKHAGGEGLLEPAKMSSSAAASSYWRVAGMNYLKYSNLCAGGSICWDGHSHFLTLQFARSLFLQGLQSFFLLWRGYLSEVYLSFICLVDMVRAAMKEPGKSAAKQRETVYFRTSQWKDGKPINNGMLWAQTNDCLCNLTDTLSFFQKCWRVFLKRI